MTAGVEKPAAGFSNVISALDYLNKLVFLDDTVAFWEDKVDESFVVVLVENQGELLLC